MKKFLSVALAAVMMLSLAACGSSSNKAESSSEGGSASDKTYIIATDTTFAPFEFTNDKNEFVGIDVDRQMEQLPVCLSQKKDRKNMTSLKLIMIPMYVWL